MGARENTTPPERRRGRDADLAAVSEAILRQHRLCPRDFYDNRKIKTIYDFIGEREYPAPFLGQMADLRSLSASRPYAREFPGEPETFWELARRHATIVLLLHLRERADREAAAAMEEAELDAASAAEYRLGQALGMYI